MILQNLSIKRKLTLITMLTSSIALITRNFCPTEAKLMSRIEAMPRMISQARAKVSARKKIQPRQVR